LKIINFGAIWCPACLVMSSRWKKIKELYPNLVIENYDFDMDVDEKEKYNIGKVLPVIIFLNNQNEEMERLVGEQSVDKLKEIIEKY